MQVVKQIGIIGGVVGVVLCAVVIKERSKNKMKLKKNQAMKIVEEAVEAVENYDAMKREQENEIKVFDSAFVEDSGPTYRGLTNADRKELTERVQGMSQEELELMIDLVPIELCLNRIQKELDRAKEFENTIKSAMANF